MTPADEDIRELTDRLGLVYARQDWGICNANAGRVGEIVRVCRSGGLTPPQQYAMIELILASMNEALLAGAGHAELVGDFEAFMRLGLHGLALQIRYGSALTDDEEVPLSGFLGRELAARPVPAPDPISSSPSRSS